MLEQLRKKRAEEGGFTLIELLIVIIILGILAAIVVFAVGTSRKDSVASSCKTNLKAVELSAEAVMTKSGAYPAATGTGGGDNLLAAANNGALLKAWPTSSDYTLTYSTPVAGSFVITVGGSNVDGGAYPASSADVVCKGK